MTDKLDMKAGIRRYRFSMICFLASLGLTLFTIVASQVGNVFACRSSRSSAFRLPLLSNRLLIVGIGFELFLVGCLLYVPFLRNIFGLQPLGVPEYLFLLLPAPLLLAIEEARKLLIRRLREGHSLPDSV